MNKNFKKTLWKKHHKHILLSTSQIIIFGFMMVILIGALLLMLPISSTSGQKTEFIDALFTSTSATCVTGLIVFDTATHWTMFGQLIILILIQIGGMGVVTIAVAIALFSGRKIGLMQRSTMQEAISAPKVGGIVHLTHFIIKGTLLVELCGAILMMPVFCKDYGFIKGIWYSIFHSISAFCNAGFDLMGVNTPFSSLTGYSSNIPINIVIMLLIIIGGIGFLTWEDIINNKWHINKYRMQSKTILLTSILLIILPAIFFYFNEFSKSEWSNTSETEKVLLSFFQSVTARTAGFNTVDFSLLTSAGITVMIILMLIGGSPGSTAGGMKTTTLAVLFATAISAFRKKNDVNLFGRRIASDTVKNASTILVMYITLFISGSIAISCIEKLPMLPCLFEASSAIATVGLSMGITPTLGTASQIILIILMFSGRVGGLTLIFAALSVRSINNSRFPQEKITVG